MEKVTLYDQENERMFDVMLSSDDARRAAEDITFATSLLNAAILDQNGTKENVKDTDISQSASDNGVPSSESYEEASLYRWSDSCVLLLLRTYQQMEEKFIDGKISHKKCWELLSKALKTQGYNITGPQCASKLRSLKKTYKSIKEHNAKSGNDRRTWQHFEV